MKGVYVSFQITRRDIEVEAGWTTRFYGVSRRQALVIEASYILTDKNQEHLDSLKTKLWLKKYFPKSLEDAQRVKNSFHKLYCDKIQTETDRKNHDAQYDEYIMSLNK